MYTLHRGPVYIRPIYQVPADSPNLLRRFEKFVNSPFNWFSLNFLDLTIWSLYYQKVKCKMLFFIWLCVWVGVRRIIAQIFTEKYFKFFFLIRRLNNFLFPQTFSMSRLALKRNSLKSDTFSRVNKTFFRVIRGPNLPVWMIGSWKSLWKRLLKSFEKRFRKNSEL